MLSNTPIIAGIAKIKDNKIISKLKGIKIKKQPKIIDVMIIYAPTYLAKPRTKYLSLKILPGN